MKISKRIKTALRILQTRIKFSPATSEVFSSIARLAGFVSRASSPVKAANWYMQAHRTTRSVGRQIAIEKTLRNGNYFRSEIITQLLPREEVDSEFFPKRVIVLKEPSPGERGVIVISFDVFGQLSINYRIDSILKDYFIVLEPSWSSYCTPEILQFINYLDTRVVVQAAEKLDYDFMNRLNANFIPVDIGASNWVDDRLFVDLKLPKEFDCIMVSHWGDLKRHYHLFEALNQIRDRSLRVCLIGESRMGRTRADLLDLADYYGVRSQLSIFENIPSAEVNRLVNQSKVNILLSRKEGANRGIFEGFFANVPGIVLRSNRGVNKNYINEFTGKLIEENELASALVWFRDNYATLEPRKWALENISCHVSTKKIEECLKQAAASVGEPWTKSIVPKVNCPEFDYYDSRLSAFDFAKYRKR